MFFADKLGAPYAEALKQVVKHARVQAESHIRTPENAEYVVAAGQADMVSIVRGQIADPHLADKAQGRPRRRHPPLPLLQPDVLGAPLSRLLDLLPDQPFGWPRIRVGRRPFHTAAQPKEVLVVGGGVAGLEAARVAAERGHR